MIPFTLAFDMRAPAFGTPITALYAEAIAMVEYADTHGMPYVWLTEHHASADGYLPTPMVLAAAMAARSKKIRFLIGVVILPLHDPIDVAEQLAILDIISNGRAEMVFGAGYARAEFAMFGVSLHDRAKLMDERIPLIQRALSGERFAIGDREIFLRPLPVQRPHPPIYIGGGVPATARRAARLGLGLRPLNWDIVPLYREECARLNFEPPPVTRHMGWVLVSEDPNKTWVEITPHLLHVAKSYAEFAEGTTSSSPFEGVDDVSITALKAMNICQVVTPDECLSLAETAIQMGGDYGISPLIGGLDPKIGWKGLELFVNKVLPRLNKHT